MNRDIAQPTGVLLEEQIRFMHSFVIYNDVEGSAYMSMDFDAELLRLRRQWCEKRAERWSVPSDQPEGATFSEGDPET